MLTKGLLNMLGLDDKELQSSLKQFATVFEDIQVMKKQQEIMISLLMQQHQNSDLLSLPSSRDKTMLEKKNGN